MKFDQRNQENFEFWFLNSEEFDEHYKSYLYFQNVVIPQLDIPQTGWMVQLGAHRGRSLDLLCRHFGEQRCLGFDLWNPEMHPRIEIQDCYHLRPLPLAFCDIDVGSLEKTPELRLHCLNWALQNSLEGAYILTNNRVADLHFGFSVEDYVESRGFEILQMDVFKDEEWAKTMNQRDRFNTRTSMLCKKRSAWSR